MMRSSFHRRARRQRGYVLLLVLGLTMLMLVGAAAIYTASDAHRMSFGQVRAQAVAVARAQQGAQEPIARLRSGNLPLASPTLPCPSNLTYCDAVYTTFNATNSGDPEYQITIFQRTVPGFSRSSVI